MVGAALSVSKLSAHERFLFIGTYTDTIYVYTFDDQNGTLSEFTKISGIKNPSFLKRKGNNIYAVNETADGAVVALEFGDKELSVKGGVSSGGDDPCYVDVNRDLVAVGNYSSGNFMLYQIASDGSFKAAVDSVRHIGSSSNSERQQSAHVHCTRFSPNGKELFVADLGTDMLYVYPIKGKKILKNIAKTVKIEAGSGPRHFEFHNNKPIIYLLNEMSGEVQVYGRTKAGELALLQSLKDDNMRSQNSAVGVGSADIHLSPNGRFLYASHRGVENCITIYAVNEIDGKLTYVGKQSVEGQTPRNFVIDPTGNYLLVANGVSDEIVVMSIYTQTGKLTPLENSVKVIKPVCLVF